MGSLRARGARARRALPRRRHGGARARGPLSRPARPVAGRARSGCHAMSLGLGLIGCGTVARAQHLPVLRRVPELRVVAAMDVDATACRALAAQWSIPRCHATVDALLADPAVEAVAICVPATAHVDVAIAALDARKHVFMEKPIALSLGEADRL